MRWGVNLTFRLRLAPKEENDQNMTLFKEYDKEVMKFLKLEASRLSRVYDIVISLPPAKDVREGLSIVLNNNPWGMYLDAIYKAFPSFDLIDKSAVIEYMTENIKEKMGI